MSPLQILVLGLIAVCQGSSNQTSIPVSNQGRIFGGLPAKENQFNYEALLVITKPMGKFVSAGSLIHPRWVLTTAHSIDSGLSVTVRLGLIDTDKWTEYHDSKMFFMHPKFNTKFYPADIGLINLGNEVHISEKIRPIRIAPKDFSYTVGEVAIVSGWGRGSSNSLKYVQQKIVEHSKCVKTFRPQRITESDLCTASVGSPEERPCMGDSGAPLVVFDPFDDKPILIGIHTAAFVGCPAGGLSIYVKPQYYLDWITNTVENNND